ncbi:hypothetical protein WDW89_02555 [Deltaproteobacteria bacterium TL4]
MALGINQLTPKKMRKWLLIVSSFFVATFAQGSRDPLSDFFPTLDGGKFSFSQLKNYPVLLIVGPHQDLAKSATELYNTLFPQYPEKIFLLLSPNYSFYIPKTLVLTLMEIEVPEQAKKHVILDWTRELAKYFFVHGSEFPMVFLLEDRGVTLGRYRYTTVKDAVEFVSETLADQL